MRSLHLEDRQVLDDKSAALFAGALLGDDSYDFLVEDDCTVYKPGGEVLLKFVTNVLTPEDCEAAYTNLRDAATPTDNRGYAGGAVDFEKVGGARNIGRVSRDGGGTRFVEIKKDGTLSSTHRANPVKSGIVGYFDRNPRFPYCRTTAYNLNKGEKFEQALPFIRSIDSVFRQHLSERYTAQKKIVDETSPDFYIKGTAFSTVTVNLNWQAAVHKDKGDYAPGFGVLTALCAGKFKGAYLCFPKYRVAVNIQTGSVLMADVHEWHGNTPFKGTPGLYERLSFVLYYREGMKYCGTAAEELDRAKHRKAGEKLNG